MRNVTFVFVNSILSNKINDDILNNDNFEFLFIDYDELRDSIENAKGKYICFICNNDSVSENYFDLIYQRSLDEFDCCYINNEVVLEGMADIRRNNTFDYLKTLKPYYLEYIWQYMFRTDVLREIINFEMNGSFDSKVDEVIKESSAIEDVIYYHDPNFNGEYENGKTDILKSNLGDFPYVDYKNFEWYKNIILIRDFHGTFSGLITWITNIGRCFGDKYDITFLYDEIYDETIDKINKYFNLVRREKFINYVCDRFIDTYLDYEFPRNIFYTEESSTFIHGLMDEGESLGLDLYDKYFAVSKTCMDTVKFSFDGNDKLDYIHNPIQIDYSLVKPHLRLVSTTRSENIKGVDRLKKLSAILEEEDIPFTWNVFTEDFLVDGNTCLNSAGFIYRKGTYNPLPFVNDSDYLVMLSDTESFCYSVLESLMLNTKVVVTPLDVFGELGVVDGKNGYIIPFEYFEDENKEKLREKVKEIYLNKDNIINYEPVSLNFDRFGELFKK